MKYTFPAILTKDEHSLGAVNVSFPDLFGVYTFGTSREEALLMAKDVLEGVLINIEGLKEIVPTPIEKLQQLQKDVVLVEVEV